MQETPNTLAFLQHKQLGENVSNVQNNIPKNGMLSCQYFESGILKLDIYPQFIIIDFKDFADIRDKIGYSVTSGGKKHLNFLYALPIRRIRWGHVCSVHEE